MSRDDDVDSFLDPVELLLAFSEACLAKELSVLVDVSLGDHLFSTSGAKLNFLLVAENGGEVLLHSGFEIGITEFLSILLQLLDCLPGVGVEALEVVEHELLIVELLPEYRVEVERNVRRRAESCAHQESEEEEHAFVSGVLGQRVEVEAFSVVSMV